MKIAQIIRLAEKRALAAITALSDVMRRSGDDNASLSCHSHAQRFQGAATVPSLFSFVKTVGRGSRSAGGRGGKKCVSPFTLELRLGY